MPAVILSPHLDDAVFSLWHVLDSPEDVTVVTVYAGIPEPGFVTPLDFDHGATDSAEWMRRRRQEDANSLEIAQRKPVHLDLLDAQYILYLDPAARSTLHNRTGGFIASIRDHLDLPARSAEVAAAVRPLIPTGEVVYAPAGIGAHPDHRAVALVAAALRDAGHPVRFWADHPYFLRRGLPSWLGGEPNPAADEIVDEGLATIAGDGPPLAREVVTLDPPRLARKHDAVRRYLTEYAAIEADFGSALDPAQLAHEVTWATAGS